MLDLWHHDPAPALNLRPVIGIMIQPLQPANPRDAALLKYGSSYVPASYVKYVEAAGGRAAPVFFNATRAERATQYAQLSGLLLPGGHVPIINSSYSTAVLYYTRCVPHRPRQ